VSGPCFAQNTGTTEAFVVDDTSATVCVKLAGATADTATHKCMALDFASGKFRDAAAPPAPPAPPAPTVKADLPKPAEGETYVFSSSADARRLITTATINKKSSIVVLDAATGKRVKVIPLGDGQGECLQSATFTGETIFAITSVCAGPGGTGYFFKPDGTQLAKIDPTTNVFDAIPLHLDGDQWAFSEFNGGSFTVWDVKAGKEIKHYVAPDEDCATGCMQAESNAFSEDNLRRTPSGKLVTLSEKGIAVVDPKTWAQVKAVRFPLCLQDAAAPK
jgi:hypothetical protein